VGSVAAINDDSYRQSSQAEVMEFSTVNLPYADPAALAGIAPGAEVVPRYQAPANGHVDAGRVCLTELAARSTVRWNESRRLGADGWPDDRNPAQASPNK
jgi:hypothetical protein